ncbi:hypothetical protein TNCV_2288381 [Trichonephila clavipes]|nr:hypothetical protein TNCV_2288381 [Trichonephila clavipes]
MILSRNFKPGDTKNPPYGRANAIIHVKSEEAQSSYIGSDVAQLPPPSRHTEACLRHQLYTSDEAHFWLNGYVNKQNCRIWSEANPQVDVETPLHPEKLTVWCALWAGGILLQKR